MSGSKPRLVWFDANRVCAAFAVVVIHSTADFSGRVFPDASVAERIVPVALRSIGELSGSEMFFFFSLFLMAMRVDRQRPTFGAAMLTQVQRLLVPFVFWTVFYAVFRLVKAQAFGYAPDLLEQLGHWQSWAGYLLLGKAQYHLHFLPTLLALFLFYPVMRLATRYPILGVALIGTLAVMSSVQGWIWSLDLDPGLRDVLIRGTKVMGYVGYGFAAFALYGLWKDGIPRGESRLIRRGALYFAGLAYMATLPFFGTALLSGQWGVRADWAFFGHFLMPVFIFCAFLGGQHLDWSPRWSRLARFTFGIYLTHPLVIDLVDVALLTSGAAAHMGPAAIVGLRVAVAMPAALLLSMGIARLAPLAWTIGLGPAPWVRGATGAQGRAASTVAA